MAGILQIASLGAATIPINILAAGYRVIPTTLVDMTLSPTVESGKDYLTGHLEDGNLMFAQNVCGLHAIFMIGLLRCRHE